MLKKAKITGIALLLLLLSILLFFQIASGFYLFLSGVSFWKATPLTILEYQYFFPNNTIVGHWVKFSYMLAVSLAALPLLVLLMLHVRNIFGKSRWAGTWDLKKAGLLQEEGILVGKRRGKYLKFPGTQHVLLAAPTRSGKGVGVVIPNMLTWKDSVVVLDIKHENWNRTAGFRSKNGQECFLLNLGGERTHCWNPLSYISQDPNKRINDIQKIAHLLYPDPTQGEPIWQQSARSLFLGITLYVIENTLEPTLGEVLRNSLSDEVLQAHIKEGGFSEACSSALLEYTNLPEKMRGSVKKVMTSTLELFQNPLIDEATSRNDFDLRDLRKKRMSVYVGVAPNNLERMRVLLNLFFQQLIDVNTGELPEQNPDLKVKCLLLLDEFPALGRMPIVAKSVAYIAGYNLRLLTILQSTSQLRELYGPDASENLMENHALQIHFAPKDVKNAKVISETIGNTTIQKVSHSRSFFGVHRHNRSATEHARPLMLEQEVRRMGQDKEIIFLENCLPIMAKKIRHYKDKAFKNRGTKDLPPNVPKVNQKGENR